MAMLSNSQRQCKMKENEKDDKEKTHGKPAHSGDDIIEVNQQTNK